MGVPHFGGGSWLPRQDPQVGQSCSIPVSHTFHATGPGVWSARKTDSLGSFSVRSDVSGVSVSWQIVAYAVVVWGCRTFDSLLPIFPPFLLLRVPLLRAFAPWAAQMPTSALLVLSFFTTLCSSFPPPVSSPSKSVFTLLIWKSGGVYNKKQKSPRMLARA